MSIKKAVFPVAGIGSRFLPATKANPKEMLPIVDKPLIQYAVEEAVRAGITHIIFVTSASKRTIEDHFDHDFALEARLQEKGQTDLLKIVRDIAPVGVSFSYTRQNQPLGLGHAILCAQPLLNQAPFAVLLADDLIDDSRLPCLGAMQEHFQRYQQSVVAVQSIPWQEVPQYGIVKMKTETDPFFIIEDMIEKPKRELAPSNLAAVGRYLFTPAIFEALKLTQADERGEIQLTNAIAHLSRQEVVHAYQFNGKRYDCGSKLGYLQATIAFGLQHPQTRDALATYLRELDIH